ncbi:MAG TPA: response regulator [Chitinophagaceae bacterium]|nr:response regulator [Chitinophagaceae bacterium]
MSINSNLSAKYESLPGSSGKIKDSKRASLENIKVLVAEDDPVNMMIASKILETGKAIVTKVYNGEEALQALGKNCFDLVLLDLEMPELSGYMAVTSIREKYPLLPVIAFTANLLDAEMRAALLQRGFTECISKPFAPDTFYNRVYAALGWANVIAP